MSFDGYGDAFAHDARTLDAMLREAIREEMEQNARYGYGYDDNDYYGSDYDSDEDKQITFYRPDGDTEGKSVAWCKSNGFFCVGEDLWSGPWYYREFPEEKKKKEDEEARKLEEANRVPTHQEIEQSIKDARKQKRSDLINELYTDIDCNTPEQTEALRRKIDELDQIDEDDLAAIQDFLYQPCGCPIEGCEERFDTEMEVEVHILDTRGKSHRRYAREHNLHTDSMLHRMFMDA